MTYDPSELWGRFWSPSRVKEACAEKIAENLWRGDRAYTLIARACEGYTTVLDMGCGGGVQYEAIRETVKDVCYEGVDISASALAFARKHYPKATFRKGDVRDLPYEKDSFSVAIIRHVLEHHSPGDAATILHEAVRVAKDKVLVLFFKYPAGKTKIHRSKAGMYVNKYSAEWLRALCFSIDDVDTIVRQRIALTKESPAYTDQDLWTILLAS